MNAALRPFSLPLADPLDTAHGTIARREGFLVRLGGADDGATDDDSPPVGVGEATPLPGWTESYDDCEAALSDAVDAIDAGADPESVLDDLENTPAARHALDLALADREAASEGVPLYQHLGTPNHVAQVPVNATLGDAPVSETVDAATEAVEAGFTCLKLKVGARSVATDVERVERVRDALHAQATASKGTSASEFELRADANAAWTREEARAFIDAVGDRLAYVEQPLPADDLEGLAALDGPIALDESISRLAGERVGDALAAEPAAVVLKPMALGGPRRTVEIAEQARDAGVLPVVTTTIDAAVARTAAVHVAAAIPERPACGLATASLLDSDLAPDIAPVADGHALVPQGDGNGTADTWGEHD